MATFVIIPLNGSPAVNIEIDASSDVNQAVNAAVRGRFEEYEVDLVEGDAEEIDIWKAIGENDYNGLVDFVEILNQNEMEIPGICYALQNNYVDTVDEAISYAENGGVREATLEELAEEFVAEGMITAADYFDYESLADDLDSNGELPEEAYDEDGNLIWTRKELMQYVYDLVDDIGAESITGRDYIDYEAIANDLRHDYDEFEFGGTTYTICTAQ